MSVSKRFVIASLFLLCATQGTASVSSRIDTSLEPWAGDAGAP